MYVWARLARMAATTGRRGPYRYGGESRLSFRCLPSDIDRNIHLNNARYMMLGDVGRIDIFLRSGIFRLCRERGWAPMMGGLQATYVREIRLWQRFEVITTIETWDGTQMIGRHRFLLEDGRTAAIVLTIVGVYDLKARHFVSIAEMFRLLGYDETPRPLDPMEAAFLASHRNLRASVKSLEAAR
ncbi:MAG: thioesterase family protein [Rhizobiaceae bacterium]